MVPLIVLSVYIILSNYDTASNYNKYYAEVNCVIRFVRCGLFYEKTFVGLIDTVLSSFSSFSPIILAMTVVFVIYSVVGPDVTNNTSPEYQSSNTSFYNNFYTFDYFSKSIVLLTTTDTGNGWTGIIDMNIIL